MLHSHTSFASRIQQKKNLKKYGVVQNLRALLFGGGKMLIGAAIWVQGVSHKQGTLSYLLNYTSF